MLPAFRKPGTSLGAMIGRGSPIAVGLYAVTVSFLAFSWWLSRRAHVPQEATEIED